MEKIDDIKTKDLEKKIADRINQIERIVGFINDLTGVIGELIGYEQDNSHTHLVVVVRDFKDFTFLVSEGHSMFGGEDFHVWYHPGKREIDIRKEPEDFYVFCQSNIREDGKVFVFNQYPEWLNVLNEMIDRQAEVIAEAKRQEENRKTQKKLQQEDDNKRKKLLKRAEELKL